MDELMEMRRQLAAVKEALDREQIANRQLLKRVMSSKASMLNRVVLWELIALPFIVVILLANCAFYDATTWVAWVFMIMAGIDIALDFKTLRVPVRDVNEMPTLELRRKLLRQRKQRNVQTIVMLILVVPWVFWAYVEWFKPMDYIGAIKSGDPGVWSIIAMLGLLLAVGILFALWLLRKINRVSDSMVAELNEPEA